MSDSHMDNYFLGLAISSTSVGWAVTDTRYHLKRAKGKDLWGVREFKEAETAEARRVARTSRRRTARKRARIGYVKELFAPEIEKVDEGFLQRLNDSAFFPEDKTVNQKYSLFNDAGFTDKEYYEKYPTIFHLRKELLHSTAPHDPRLVYLAVANLFSCRGNFLSPALQEGTLGDFNAMMKDADELAADLYPSRSWSLTKSTSRQQELFLDKNLTGTRELEALLALTGTKKSDKEKKEYVSIYKLLCGLKAQADALLPGREFSDEDGKVKFSFAEGEFDETEAEAARVGGDDFGAFLSALKSIYDWTVLCSIMTDDSGHTYDYISEAKVAEYDLHHKQLSDLKKVIKLYAPAEYDAIFREMGDNSYSAYAGSTLTKKKKVNKDKSVKTVDFMKRIKTILEKIKEEQGDIPEVEAMLLSIEQGSFLPKQREKVNAVIPNQVYATELNKILDNAKNYLPFLTEKDGSGLTGKERLMMLFRFRIPYFVGPLQTAKDSNAWVVRKELGRVFPWNIEEKVDMTGTAEAFINNLVGRCTYLEDKKVLPKDSLLYEKFRVLNEINNLTVHEKRLSVEEKQALFTDLFMSGRGVTVKGLVRYLKRKGILTEDEGEEAIGGFDKKLGKFTNSLSTLRKFQDIFETPELTKEEEELAEKIVYYSVIYGENKKYLAQVLSAKLPKGALTEEQIKKACALTFTGWGNLSKDFLLLEGAYKETGEAEPLIKRLWTTDRNMMQLISDDSYTYKETIEAQTKRLDKTISEVTYEDLDTEYVSAPVRRMVWQAIRIVQEVVEVMGRYPSRIFIETSRYDGKKGDDGRKETRKRQLEALYKKCGKEDKPLLDEIEALDEKDFRDRRLYLYYKQKGRSMYTGLPIPKDKLHDPLFYDIDHIYPQRYTDDNSIENNLVLVERELNHDKEDMLLDGQIRQKMTPFWAALREEKFMNDVKFARLTRDTPFTEDEYVSFIEKKVSVTGQGVKEISRILDEALNTTDSAGRLVYVKSGNIADFRNQYKEDPAFVKCTSLNDHWAAKDAYLSIPVGNGYYTKFTANPRNYIRSLRKEKADQHMTGYNISRVFKYEIRRNEYIAWEPKEDLSTVSSVMKKNSCLISRKANEVQGAFANLMAVSAKAVKASNAAFLPLKSTIPHMTGRAGMEKYGAYTSLTGSYFCLVEHTVKGKRIRTIEPVFFYSAPKHPDKHSLDLYCENILKLKDPDVRVIKITKQSHIRKDGFDYYITGRTNNNLTLQGAVEMTLPPEWQPYINTLTKAVNEKWDSAFIKKRNARIKEINSRGMTQELPLTAEKNEELYELIEKKYQTVFKNRIGKAAELIEDGAEAFKKLSCQEQIATLCQLIASPVTLNGIDLTTIGGSAHSALTRCSNVVSGAEEYLLIDDSVTGIYQKETDLLTV